MLLLRAPENWPRPVVALVFMLLLGLLDLVGSWAAKEAVDRRSLGWAAVGAVFFLAVFWVYLSSLTVAGLAVVTLGWIVVVQVGVVLLDRYRYGESLPRGAWVVVALLLIAQAYLIMGPKDAERASADHASAERGEQAGDAHGRDLGEPGHHQGAARDDADEQDVADDVVTGVGAVTPGSVPAGARSAAPTAVPGIAHVSPPKPRSAPPTEGSALTEPLPVTE